MDSLYFIEWSFFNLFMKLMVESQNLYRVLFRSLLFLQRLVFILAKKDVKICFLKLLNWHIVIQILLCIIF